MDTVTASATPSALSARDRRALRVGAWVGLPVLAWSLLVRPMLATIELQRDRVAAERAVLAAERAALAGSGATGPTIAEDRLFAGRDAVVASAEFAAWLGEVTRTHDLALEDVSTRPVTREVAGLRTLRADLAAEGDLEGMLRFLATLEAGRRLVRIDAFELQPHPDGVRADGTEPLIVRASLSAFAPEEGATEGLAPALAPDALDAHRDAARATATANLPAAVRANVLSPSRSAPTARYRLARSTDEVASDDVFPGEAPAIPVVLGTAAGGGGAGFAMARLGEVGAAQVVRAGDRLGSWTVVSIARGRVVFRDADGARVTIDAPSPPDGVMP
jgi:hypothetical protein